MAFQPIVDIRRRTIFAYEALVRGTEQESATDILGQVTEDTRAAFDQSCRIKAMILAQQLGIADQGALLSVNFMPGTHYSAADCFQRTVQAAEWTGFPLTSLMFEISEMESLKDTERLSAIATEYRRHGLTVALDDFGAGNSGLNLLADIDVQVIKLDGRLVRGIDSQPRAQEIVRSTAAMANRLGIQIVGECIETRAELDILLSCGITLLQGYLFAKPTFESLPEIIWPDEPLQRRSLSLDSLELSASPGLSSVA
ncbi:MAG TPA: EAL domain-containing protein [Acidobacteriaceae bacterium]|nr:EAL domain-containing protein [Acidobacteriaceae bacterium]